MQVPDARLVKVVVVTEIVSLEGEAGVYAVKVLFDHVAETFHVELEGDRVSFKVRERRFYSYQGRCSLKGFYALMRKWHRGERCRLPVDVSGIDFV